MSFTNTGDTFFLEDIGGTAQCRCEWRVYYNTSLISKRRSVPGDSNLLINMYDYPINNSDTLDIKVISYGNGTNEFNCEVKYYYG